MDIYQLSFDDADDDGVVFINHLLALSGQTLIRDQLTGFFQIPQDLILLSARQMET